MKINVFGRSLHAAMLVLAVVLIGACDDEAPTGVPLENFESEPIADAINEMLATVNPAAEATQQIYSILDQLDIWEGGLVIPQSAASLAPRTEALLADARRYIPVMPHVEFGAAAGNTYVYDLSQNEWVVDPDDTGDAPANGIRLTIYDITPVGALGSVVGYADLVDLDDETAERLGVVVVDTSGDVTYTVTDMTHSVTITETATGSIEHAEAVGVLRSGPTEEVDFEVVSTLERTGAGDQEELANEFRMSFMSPTSSYVWEIASSDDEATGDYTEDMLVSVSAEGVVTSLDVVVEGNENDTSLDGVGSISQGGQLVANVFVEQDYDFTSPDGDAFSRGAKAELRATVSAMLAGGVYLLTSVPVLFHTPFLP